MEKKNNELQMQNHHSQPSGSIPLLETNYGQRRLCGHCDNYNNGVGDKDIVVVMDDVVMMGSEIIFSHMMVKSICINKNIGLDTKRDTYYR